MLGKARRELGQKKGSEWNEEKNARMVKRLDVDGSGKVEEKEFVNGFDEVLNTRDGLVLTVDGRCCLLIRRSLL